MKKVEIDYSERDRMQSVFTKIKVVLEARLAYWREKNDACWTEIETAEIRGRITEIKGMLAEMADNEQPERNHD